MGAHPHMAGPESGSGQGPGTGYVAPPGHAQLQGGAGLAHYGAHAPQPAGYGGGGGDAGFDDTPMSPPEEERGAPPSAPAPSAARKPLHPTLSPAPDRDRGAHAAARAALARAPEGSAGAPDAAASKRVRLHDPAPGSTPNGVCTPVPDGAAPPAANGHGRGGAHAGAPGAREGDPDERLAHVAAAAAAVAAGQVRYPPQQNMMQGSPCILLRDPELAVEQVLLLRVLSWAFCRASLPPKHSWHTSVRVLKGYSWYTHIMGSSHLKWYYLQVSTDSIAVRDSLRMLDPAEGLAVIAWLLERLPRNVKPSGVTQARNTPCPRRVQYDRSPVACEVCMLTL